MTVSLTIEADTIDELRAKAVAALGLGVAVVAPEVPVEALKTKPASKPASKPVEAEVQPEPVAVPRPEPVPSAPAEPEVSTLEVGSDESTAGSAETATEALVYEDVRTAILRVSVNKGREAVFSILQKFGATKTAKEIDPVHWPEVIAATKAALAA